MRFASKLFEDTKANVLYSRVNYCLLSVQISRKNTLWSFSSTCDPRNKADFLVTYATVKNLLTQYGKQSDENFPLGGATAWGVRVSRLRPASDDRRIR